MYVLMVTPNKFPNGDAGAVRDEYFAKIYIELGYDVYHIGMGPETKTGTYKGIKYYSTYNENISIVQKIRNSLNYRSNVERIYEDICKEQGEPSVIHIYDIPKSGIEWAISIAKQNRIPIIHDSVEWYSPCEFKHGKFAYPYILKNRTNTRLIRKPISVIAISSYLQNYFREKGLYVTRIPVVMDSNEYFPKERHEEDKINIVYAGSPAKKDYLQECVLAYERLSDEIKEKIEFTILGVTGEYLIECTNKKRIPKGINALGRVSRETVISHLEKADFSILLRPENERYTKAGFPTKSVEAMMNGSAMLCNITSDLSMYLNDGENAIIVKDSSIDSMYDAFIRVAELSHEELTKLRGNARKTAECSFDYHLYVQNVNTIINESKSGENNVHRG